MAALRSISARDRAGRQSGSRQGWGGLCAIAGLAIGSLPLAAAAQITQPLLPLPAPPTLLPTPEAPTAPTGLQAPAAPGQPTIAGQTVTSRPRPDYDPIGMRFGDFFWFPHAEVDEVYNSNIFALQSGPTGDLITLLQPGFDLLSSFPRNALNLHAGAAAGFYARDPTQNTATGFVSADGRLDVDANSGFFGSTAVAHLYTPRTSPNSPLSAAEPVTYNQYNAALGYQQSGRRLGYEVDLAVQAAQYNAVPLIGGGVLPQSGSNSVIPEAALRVNYEFIPDYRAYVRVAGSPYDYYNTPNFNSTTYRVDVGLQILPRHLIYGEAYVGYLTQRFNSSSFPSTSTPDAGARVVWNPTPLTTVNLSGFRTFQTTNPTSDTGAGYLQSVVIASADHELRHNILLNAYAGFENDDYQGTSRADNTFSGGAAIRYLVNRKLFLVGSYSFQRRLSSGINEGIPYSQSIVMLRLGTQF